MRFAAFVLCFAVPAGPAWAQVFKPSDPGAKGEEIWVETSEDAAHSGDSGEQVQIQIEQPRTADPDPEPPPFAGPPPPFQTPPPLPEDFGPPLPEAPKAGTASADSVSLDHFVAALSRYGAWVTVEGMGKVWRPYPALVGYHFHPYSSAGRWAMTEYGWTWVSDYDWGWAVFHYGRWWMDPYYGWVWYPGFSWSPAWVTWWYGDGFYGWIPTAPFDRTYGKDLTERVYTFVQGSHFASVHLRDSVERGARVDQVLKSATEQKALEWKNGPPVEMISHAQGQPVHIETLAASGAIAGHPAPKSIAPAKPPDEPKDEKAK